jgi:type IV pilus assembly protein PilC
MADTYLYRVRDNRGALLRGSIEADSPSGVVARLRSMGYIPLSIERKAGDGLKSDVKLPFIGNRVKLDELSVFSRQFATMIDSGLTLLRALAILGDQTENKAFAEALKEVRIDVEQGASLSHALGRHPKMFPKIYVAMVRSGETGGSLDAALIQLADTLEKQTALRRKIKSAMTYPVAVFILVNIILTAMLVFVVPAFKSIFTQLGGTLPLPTQILVTVSDKAIILIPLGILSGIVGTYLFRRWIAKPTGRLVWDAFKLRVPLFGKLVHLNSIARACRTLAALTRAGVPLLESLEITKETSGNVIVGRALSDVQDGVSGGEPIARRLANHAVIPAMMA